MKLSIAIHAVLLVLATALPAAAQPDLLIRSLEVRDRGRLGLVTPTANNNITVYAEIENRSGTSAPDVAFRCRRLPASGGTVIRETTIRTGALAAGSTRRLSLEVIGSSTAIANRMWCMVDAERVREAGDMRRYPGGDLPAAGRTVRVSLWLAGINLQGRPPASAMPATLTVSSTVRVGAFLPNLPVLHVGDQLPQPAWAPAQALWWSRSVLLNIPNPESAVRPE